MLHTELGDNFGDLTNEEFGLHHLNGKNGASWRVVDGQLRCRVPADRHRRGRGGKLRVKFKARDEDKAHELLKALESATGAKRAIAIRRLKQLTEKNVTYYLYMPKKYTEGTLDVWKRALALLAAEPAPPPKRKKSPLPTVAAAAEVDGGVVVTLEQ